MDNIIDKLEFADIKKIAEGGQGAVYKAKQKGVEGFEKTVAIKMLLERASRNQQFVDLFIAEAKLVANLVHENIVQIYQLGKTGKNYYFVLEYINGISLYDFITRHVNLNLPFPPELAVFVASRVVRGLAYAHSRTDSSGRALNIVHCDVCPHNILITTEGLPKLTDFGIAKATSMVRSEFGLSGKLLFMSPEQASQKTLDFRSDIYSLGAVLFNMLTGKPIRDTHAKVDEILAQARGGAVDWGEVSSFDEELVDILRRMLAIDPGERYPSTDELARDLEYYIYKDGYGPTIVALAKYMREQLPQLYQSDISKEEFSTAETFQARTLPLSEITRRVRRPGFQKPIESRESK
jgi:eukaryotic-like serine/threonine-protein kinase